MEQVDLVKPTGLKGFINAFWDKHGQFFSTVYTFAFYFSMILAFIQWLKLVFDSIRAGNFFTFVFAILLQSILMTFNAFLGAAFYGTIAIIILILPYLIIRGFMRK